MSLQIFLYAKDNIFVVILVQIVLNVNIYYPRKGSKVFLPSGVGADRPDVPFQEYPQRSRENYLNFVWGNLSIFPSLGIYYTSVGIFL